MIETVGPRIVHSALATEAVAVDELTASIAVAPLLRPFDPEALAICERLSSTLLRMRAEPAAVSLGYWLRSAQVQRLRTDFQTGGGGSALQVPLGTVLHVTPANVDTMFAYSWVLSLLAGNRNIVRLSSRSSGLRDRLVGAVADALAGSPPAVRAANLFVLTEHDDGVMTALSAAADGRVLWGGDRTIERLRHLPVRPRGRDVTFPDRHSLAILDVEAVIRATPEELTRLGVAFFNDAFWFDQGACSSPRLLLWARSGQDPTAVAAARSRFHRAVRSAIDAHGYEAQVGIAISKLTMSMARAAATPATIERDGNEATWVLLEDLAGYDRESCGGGLFFEVISDDLQADLLAFAGIRDQTAACYGLGPERARALAEALNGRGVDRWVPIGRALEFAAVWDGYDLLAQLTRRVTIDLPQGPARRERSGS